VDPYSQFTGETIQNLKVAGVQATFHASALNLGYSSLYRSYLKNAYNDGHDIGLRKILS